MKKLLFGLFFLVMVGGLHAQAISFTANDSLQKWTSPGGIVEFHCLLENLWNQNNTVGIRAEPHYPPDWNLHICTKLGCAPPGILYVEDPLEAFEVDTAVSIGIHSGATPDTGWVITTAFSTHDTTYRDTLTHTLYTTPNGIIVRTEPGIPERFRLAQNYPNPFNPSTTISISIPEHLTGQEGSLQVYDILGREVRTLYRGSLTSGVITVHWDGRNAQYFDVPSGVYFYRFSASDMNVARFMQLIR